MTQHLSASAQIFLPLSFSSINKDTLKKWSLELKDLIYNYCVLYQYDFKDEEQDRVSEGLNEYEKLIKNKFLEINYDFFHKYYSNNHRLLNLHCFLHNYLINGPDIELSKNDIEIYKSSIDSFVEKIDA